MLSTIVVAPEVSAALAALIASILTAIAARIRSSGQNQKKPATNEDVMKRLDDIDAGIKKLDDRALGDHDILMRLLERRR